MHTSAFQSSSVAIPSSALRSSAAPLSSRERRWSGARCEDASKPQSSGVKSEKSRAREWRFDRRSNSVGEMRGPKENVEAVRLKTHCAHFFTIYTGPKFSEKKNPNKKKTYLVGGRVNSGVAESWLKDLTSRPGNMESPDLA